MRQIPTLGGGSMSTRGDWTFRSSALDSRRSENTRFSLTKARVSCGRVLRSFVSRCRRNSLGSRWRDLRDFSERFLVASLFDGASCRELCGTTGENETLTKHGFHSRFSSSTPAPVAPSGVLTFEAVILSSTVGAHSLRLQSLIQIGGPQPPASKPTPRVPVRDNRLR